ncbi:MAG: SH3 domain-containing protein [Dysgonamonadaceae bacterium]|nr:SH3 domain-containing protein [Dysgonamonadaceae bacterium]MDD4729381.1 SH3 domain-containing protein [Dysgonamonadaceae bacterium]
MALLDKYKELVDLAKQSNVIVKEENGVLRITGEVSNADIKDKMWKIYNQLDPNFKSGEVVLNVEVKSREGSKVKVATQSGNLNIRQAPGTEQYLVGKAAHGEVLTLLKKVDNQWWHIRTNEGLEGYCYAQYLEAID